MNKGTNVKKEREEQVEEKEVFPRLVSVKALEFFFGENTFGTRTVIIHQKSNIWSLELGMWRVWLEERDRNPRDIAISGSKG